MTQNIEDMKIISIDDNPTNLLLVETYADTLHVKIDSFLNPKEGLKKALEGGYDLLIVDYMMPELNGIELIKELRKQDKNIVILMLTAAGDDVKLQVQALEVGATDFLAKPIVAPTFKARVTNLLNLRKDQMLLENRALLLEEEVLKATKRLIDREHETLRVLGKTAEYKDPETASHVARVASYSKILAKAYGLNEKLQDIIFYASPFHDIGKVGIQDSILLKPARLNDDEFSVMKRHSLIGYEILKNTKSEYLKAGGIIALSHHEKFDGSGYPHGLKGESIPIFGRIVAIADVFDALTSMRPYKKAWSFEEGIEFIKEQSGTHFDPTVVECFINSLKEIKETYENIKE